MYRLIIVSINNSRKKEDKTNEPRSIQTADARTMKQNYCDLTTNSVYFSRTKSNFLNK